MSFLDKHRKTNSFVIIFMSFLDTYRKTLKMFQYRTCEFVNFYILFISTSFPKISQWAFFFFGGGLILEVKNKLRNAWMHGYIFGGSYIRGAYFRVFTVCYNYSFMTYWHYFTHPIRCLILFEVNNRFTLLFYIGLNNYGQNIYPSFIKNITITQLRYLLEQLELVGGFSIVTN